MGRANFFVNFFIGLFLSLLLMSCGGGGGSSTTQTTGGGGSGSVSDSTLSGLISTDGTPGLFPATVYVIGQQDNAVQTDSEGNFSLGVDMQLSGLILAGLRAEGVKTEEYDLVVISNGEDYGKKTEVVVTEGKSNEAPGIVMKKNGSIRGKAFLQNASDHSGITVYIPGTGFSAITDANGNYSIPRVPDGTYDFLRAEKFGTVYHYAIQADVTVTTEAETVAPDMFLMLSVGPFGKILINNGAAFSSSADVTLQLATKSDAILMQISNDPFFMDIDWEPVKASYPYTFIDNYSSGGATARIYTRFAEESGLASAPTGASIYIDTDPLATKVSGATTNETRPTLDWQYTPPMPTPRYNVEFAAGIGFSPLIASSYDITASQFTLPTARNAGTYYWRVQMYDENGVTRDWAGPWDLTIDFGTVELNSPVNLSFTNDVTPMFGWSTNPTAATYNLVLSQNSDLSSPVLTKNGLIANGYTLAAGEALPNTDATDYYWAATPVDQYGILGTQSSVSKFTLDTAAPTGSISINNGEPFTTGTAAALNLTYDDGAGSGLADGAWPGWYVSESQTLPGSPSWGSSTDFTLSSGSGDKVVYVWFRDALGNVSQRYSDNIRLVEFGASTIVEELGLPLNGTSSSLALDSAGKAHISFYNAAIGDLGYATNSTGSWTVSTIDANPQNAGFSTSIAIGLTDKVHISYRASDGSGNNALRYATNSGGGWVMNTVAAYASYSSSIAVDSSGRAHISFYNAGLVYATNAGGSFVLELVDGSAEYSSIALDSLGKAHISYYDGVNANLKYATNASGAFINATVDSTGDTGLFADMALDSDGYAHISYAFVNSGSYDVRYATNAGGAWSIQTLADNLLSYSYSSMALDPSGKVHIIYYKGGELMYATNKYENTWYSGIVDNLGFGGYGESTSIAVNPSTGKVHISYHNWARGALKYAESQ